MVDARGARGRASSPVCPVAALVAALVVAPASALAQTWSVGARLQAAHEHFDGVHTNDGRARSATWWRRADVSLAVEHGAWHAELTADLELEGSPTARIDSATLHWRASAAQAWRWGRFDPDFGFARSGSSAVAPALEDSPLWDLAPEAGDGGDALGLQWRLDLPRWHATAGTFDRSGFASLDARAVRRGFDLGRGQAQLGLSLHHTVGWAGDGRLRSRLGVRGSGETASGRRVTLAPAGAFDASTAWALEAAWLAGPLLLQAEVLNHRLGAVAGPARHARGGELQAAWMWAGPARRMRGDGARIDGPRMASGQTAWESVLRWTALGVSGERSARVAMLGLNVWTGRRVRLSLGVQHTRIDDPVGPGLRDGTAWLARWQWRI